MPVKFSVVPKKNPRDQAAPAKYYANARSNGNVTLRQLAKQIAEISTVSTIDTIANLEALLQVIPNHIADGKIVRLGDFGSFRLTITSEGSETEDDVTSSNIKGNKLKFQPGKVFKTVLNNIEYEKL